MTSRRTGRVKFFNCAKGYGFIIPAEGNAEGRCSRRSASPSRAMLTIAPSVVFVHHSAIVNMGGYKTLAEGQEVEYDLVEGPKGWQAGRVTGPGGQPVVGDPAFAYAGLPAYPYDSPSSTYAQAPPFGYVYAPYTQPQPVMMVVPHPSPYTQPGQPHLGNYGQPF
ncbi:uncharacterized protein VTP21DRAFT_8354 [Calcarisporiella thermophila]|uniref:uncharacterized protein n=1 Tax=Calcarisporiella thermophila TaxID=911321 RepID=UPI0037449CD1